MAGISTNVSVQDNLSAAFKTMTQSINICLSSFVQMQEAANQNLSATAISDARAALNDANIAASQLAEQLENAGDKQEQFNTHVKSGESALGKLTSTAMRLVTAYASIQGVKGVLNLSDTLTQTTARLNMMNDGLQTTEELQTMIFQSAQRSRGSYQATADAVAKMGIMAKDAFSSNAELVAFAEQLNKQFTIAGTSSEGVSAAMLQLTQAMGSGALRGEELNSVFEQAPTIIQTIADYLDVPIGKIREMAANGEISASVVKSALLSAADETNAKFESMPMTWGQIATSIKNQALMAFQPILTKLNEIANNEKFNTFVNGIIGALYTLANVAVEVFDILVSAASIVCEYWDIIAPIIVGVATALLIYNAALIVYNIIQGISNALKTISIIKSVKHGAAITSEMLATTGMTKAQLALNAALWANPVAIVIGVIILLITVLYGAVAAINHFKGTSISATGIIAGVFAVLGSFLYNSFIVPTWNYFANIANFFANVFNDPVAAVKILFYDLAQDVIGYVIKMAEAIEKVINKIPGVKVDMTSGLDNLYNSLEAASQKAKEDSEWEEVVKKMNYIDYEDAYDAGYNFGKGIDDKIKKFFSKETEDASKPYDDDILDSLGNIQNNTASGADSTEKIADSMEIAEEDLKYLRDIAEREIIDRTVFKTLNVEVGGISNTVNNMTDLDGIGDYLGNLIVTTAAASMEG